MPDAIGDDVFRFLAEVIESYEQLEVLLLLRERAADKWTRERIGEHLGLDSDSIARGVAQLVLHDLLEQRDSTVRYRPRSTARAETVGRLAAAYGDERRVQIMRAMNANAMQRLRNNAARVFADAFVVGKDKKDG